MRKHSSSDEEERKDEETNTGKRGRKLARAVLIFETLENTEEEEKGTKGTEEEKVQIAKNGSSFEGVSL